MVLARGFLERRRRVAAVGVVCLLAAACKLPPSSIGNGWLDPSVVGTFEESKMLEIRSSLTIEDEVPGIAGAVLPNADDLRVIYEEHPISAGDTLSVEIFELRDRQIPFQAQLQVSSTGMLNLPVVGRVMAAGLTPPEFEQALDDLLIERDILREPDVTIQPLFLQKATYSIFGIGVSASNNAPLRAGTFPIRSPELRLLEAINQVGGLNEFVTDVYVFRSYVEPPESDDASSDDVDGSDAPADVDAPDVETSGEGSDADPILDDLLAVVEESEEPVAAPGDEAGDAVENEAVAQSLEPDPSAPFIFINGEFVQNPDYVPPRRDDTSATEAVDFGAPAPWVNWARVAGDSNYRVLLIPAELLREGDPQANVYVRPGDVIRIVQGEIGVYYVMGQVNRVGAFAFNSESVTLKAAVAAAGGLSSLAWPDRCTVYRKLGRREQMIQVDLDRIFAGQDADFLIRRGDIVNVGTHPFAPFLQRIRSLTLPNPVSNVGYSFTYARNFADIDSFAAQRNPNNDTNQGFPLIFP